MTTGQSVIRYCAIALAVLLSVTIIASVVFSIAGVLSLLGGKRGVGEMKTFEIGEEVKSLDINIGAAELKIVTGGEFRVESNIGKLTVSCRNGVLKISEKRRLSLSYDGKAVLKVCIPEGTVFEKLSLDAGAGTVDIDSVSAETVKLDLGAGKTEIGMLVATGKAEIDGGAGKISVKDGRINSLEADTGAGAMNIAGVLTGTSRISIGVGRAELTLRGGEDAYRFDIDKGIGRVTVGGREMSDGEKCGSGDNLIEIDGGIGSVTVTFAD